jgi:hypothetical protein
MTEAFPSGRLLLGHGQQHGLVDKGRHARRAARPTPRDLGTWGDRWTAGDASPPILYRHRACGQITHVEPRCALCGEPMHAADVDVERGPGSD